MSAIEYDSDKYLMKSKVVTWYVDRQDGKVINVSVSMMDGERIVVANGYQENAILALKQDFTLTKSVD